MFKTVQVSRHEVELLRVADFEADAVLAT